MCTRNTGTTQALQGVVGSYGSDIVGEHGPFLLPLPEADCRSACVLGRSGLSTTTLCCSYY